MAQGLLNNNGRHNGRRMDGRKCWQVLKGINSNTIRQLRNKSITSFGRRNGRKRKMKIYSDKDRMVKGGSSRYKYLGAIIRRR